MQSPWFISARNHLMILSNTPMTNRFRALPHLCSSSRAFNSNLSTRSPLLSFSNLHASSSHANTPPVNLLSHHYSHKSFYSTASSTNKQRLKRLANQQKLSQHAQEASPALRRFAAIGDNSPALCERDSPIDAYFRDAPETPEDKQTTVESMVKHAPYLLAYWTALYCLCGLFIFACLELLGVEPCMNALVRIGLFRRKTANDLILYYQTGHKWKTLAFLNECMEFFRFPILYCTWRTLLKKFVLKAV